MPDRSTILRWVDAHEAFRDQYALAREAGLDAMADEILAIADDGTQDVRVDADGKETVDWEVVNRSKLRVDARKWLLSKLAPKKYGDKITQELTGKDGATLVPMLNVLTTSARPDHPDAAPKADGSPTDKRD